MLYLEKLVIDNIKRIRHDKGISQEKLAEACNTATSYIGLMEIYKNIPKLSTIERIANALDIDPLELFYDKERQTETAKSNLKAEKEKILAFIGKELDKILHI
ncbi:MAG: helix-turn-helix domain-containing protein [Spirochaetaceae bacterium]|jgi:transcriptional regulator with XRE-family HTH domain|nr:helix-turn-helix domain-containing protein [Spirochaetaceae bacterium]